MIRTSNSLTMNNCALICISNIFNQNKTDYYGESFVVNFQVFFFNKRKICDKNEK